MHSSIRDFFVRIIRCFTGYNFFYHVVGAIITYIAVQSGFDWFYFNATQSPELQLFTFSTVIIGSIGTFSILIILLLTAIITKNKKLLNTTFALIQAILISIIIITIYKALTGRAHPPHMTDASLRTDISHLFNFGFMRGGVFQGWPSGHTAAAFAFGVTIWKLYPKNRIKYLAMLYAFYIGIGVSTNIHWFSDFFAGALIGTTIGKAVSKDFSLKRKKHGIE
ncbi:hypothetical protein COY05_00265 [Candidatus Peregrinibacteria bacterium CG_4_10_14_0_2_um_filter_38_24]|nr:MAG: hypothetical protein COY05_00265 [Candidatus Peregrinibacteria bacterium CG_4_10_14_0_2_um_filter_38_24]PJC39067.1 MAG: hypothetical protein CO044_01705 [Candidatus Peregrinibacteria bacterium CG_4_9_14_0_2_um_filter_38_9]